MVQDYGFARILGEETPDLPTSYASSAQFTLPKSGLVVTYPKGYFVRPNGDELLRGVVPDLPIEQAVFNEGHEAVLRAAVEMVRGSPPKPSLKRMRQNRRVASPPHRCRFAWHTGTAGSSLGARPAVTPSPPDQ